VAGAHAAPGSAPTLLLFATLLVLSTRRRRWLRR